MKSALIKTAVLGLFAAASVPSFATCTGADCDSSSNTTVKFDSSYYLSPNATGIYIQSNTGNRISEVKLNNLLVRNDGAIEATSTAAVNTINVDLGKNSDLVLKHVNQTNRGDQLATNQIVLNGASKAGEVTLSSQAIANSFNYTGTNSSTSLAELSLVQCNVGNGAASVTFQFDPTKMTATSTALANAINIVQK